jgi:hypothetical protein
MKLLSIILALFLSLCAHSLSDFVKADGITSDEYAVYSALIQSMYVKQPVQTVVVDKQTQFYKIDWERPEDYRKSILAELSSISEETIEDFEKKNETEGELARHLNLTVDYVLLGKQSSARTPEEHAKQWKEFDEKYPNSPGIISLSRVGFNSDKDQALVYVANRCGGLCGKGYYVLLMKSGERWKVQKEMLLWVS